MAHPPSPVADRIIVLLPPISPTMTFDEASRAVVGYLRTRMPWGYWSVARISGAQQTHLHMGDNDFGVPEGITLPLQDSLCIRMLAGEGPTIAPDVHAVPAYAEQPAVRDFGIAAYAGIPIVEADGGLFGSLCGLSRNPVDADVEADTALLELLAGLLGMVLAADRQRDREARARHAATAKVDPLTALPDRDAWHDHLIRTEIAHAKFGDPAAVVLLEVDAVDDTGLLLAAEALAALLPDRALLARTGHRELGVLLHGPDAQDADDVCAVLCTALAEAGLPVPLAVVAPFPGALAEADEAMHRRRAQQRVRARG